MVPPHAAVVGLAGAALGRDEAALLRELPPLGVMLFRRNVVDPGQLAALVGALRDLLPAETMLFVDQEGGRVARLGPPHWPAHPPASLIGAVHAREGAAGRRAAFLTGALIGLECAAAGFDVVCAPVLDRRVAGASDVIGDRAFGVDAASIVPLAGSLAEGLLAAGVHPIGKHAPGHGPAAADSHLALPRLHAPTEADLQPFQALAWLPWMMTAHILFTGLDRDSPATLSRTVLQETVRGAIGFRNLLISDDLAMGALTGAPGVRVRRCLAAGCDIALHCSGRLEESRAVLEATPRLAAPGLARLDAARALVASRRQTLDAAALRAERNRLLC